MERVWFIKKKEERVREVDREKKGKINNKEMACNKFSPFTCYYMLVNFYLNPLPSWREESVSCYDFPTLEITIFSSSFFSFFFLNNSRARIPLKTLFTLFPTSSSLFLLFLLFFPNDKLNIFFHSFKVTWNDVVEWNIETQLKSLWKDN